MVFGDSTKIGGERRRFPTTQWEMLEGLREADTAACREIIVSLYQIYWKPVYCYICSRGHRGEDAKDLTQQFLIEWIEKGKFARADRTRARFRTFLLASLNNFLKSAYRDEHAIKRYPSGGIVSIEDVIKNADIVFDPRDEKAVTPEDVFNRTWVLELLLRVLRMFEQECRATGKEVHYELLRMCIVEPELEGEPRPPRRELAQKLHLTEKEVANRLLTARRAFMRLLRKEIRTFAFSDEDVALETKELFHFLAGS